MKTVMFKGQMNGLDVDRATRDSEYNMVKHWHPEYEIQYFYQGKRCFFVDQQKYNVKTGSLVIVDSYQIHNTYSDKDPYHDRVVIHVDREKFQSSGETLGIDLKNFFKNNRGFIQIPKVDRNYVESCLQELSSELNQKGYLYQTAVQLHLFELLIYLERLKNSGAKDGLPEKIDLETNDIVNEIGHYISENYATVGSLEDIAKTFYLDKSYLSRIFKKYTGYTVTEFTNIQRAQQAQRLLEDTEMTVGEISEQVGYENITYFNRVFKKYVDTSPLKYRKKQIAYKKSLREKNNF